MGSVATGSKRRKRQSGADEEGKNIKEIRGRQAQESSCLGVLFLGTNSARVCVCGWGRGPWLMDDEIARMNFERRDVKKGGSIKLVGGQAYRPRPACAGALLQAVAWRVMRADRWARWARWNRCQEHCHHSWVPA